MIIILNVIKRYKPNKDLAIVLQSVYGIGMGRSRKIVNKLTGRRDLKLHSVRDVQLTKFSSIIRKKNFILQINLEMLRKKNLRRLKKIRCYRGLRLSAYLPSHGQRTKSNGLTARFQGSGSFEYVPTTPATGLKKTASYVRHPQGLKKRSEQAYNKLLNRNFKLYQLQKPNAFKYAIRRGQLGVFNRLAGVKRKKTQKAKK